MRGLAAGLKLQPQTAFVRSDYLAARRLTDDREIRLDAAGRQRARAGLSILFVHQTGEDNFGFGGPPLGLRKFAERSEHRGNGTFGVARPTSEEASVNFSRSKLRCGAVDGVEMRRKQDALPYFAGG